jgi:putative FmdB family regulatory protein
VPIYDYGCGACGRVTEVIHGINDTGPRFCPSCGAEGTMRKALSAPAVVFKGSGWAKVDRRSSSGGSSSGGSSSGRSAAKSGSGAAGDTSASPGSATHAPGSGSKGPSAETTGTGSSSDGGGGD